VAGGNGRLITRRYPAPPGRGGAAQVADALAGRTNIAAVLGDLPASSRAALSPLADSFNTPIGQDQA